MKPLLKNIIYILETILFIPFAVLGYVVPFKIGSAIGGKLFSFLGTTFNLKINKVIRKNLSMALPDIDQTRQDEIIKGMWGNLGRTFMEYFSLSRQNVSSYEVEGLEYLDQLINDGKPGLMFSAHYGNWEIGTYIAHARGMELTQVTRFLNNPYMQPIVNWIHELVARKVIPKGPKGARQIIKEMQQKRHVSMLMDQKMNEGLPIPFFGRDAMTASAIAKIALKYDCPILPFHVIRTKGAKCKVIYHPPIIVDKDSTKTNDEQTIEILTTINNLIEGWIRDHPEQWFWVHRRWNKDLYKE